MKDKLSASNVKANANVKTKTLATANAKKVKIKVTATNKNSSTVTVGSGDKPHNLSGYAMELWLTNLVLRLISPQSIFDKKTKTDRSSKIQEQSDKLLSFKVLQNTHSLAKDFEKISRHILPGVGVLIPSFVISNSVVSYLYYLEKQESGKGVAANKTKAKALQQFINRVNQLSPYPVLSIHPNLTSAKSAVKNKAKKAKVDAQMESLIPFPLVPSRYIRELHNLLEMAFIYGCSFVKIGVRADEIEHAIYDYLNAKTFHSIESRIKVEVRHPGTTSGVSIECLAENAEIITEACVIKISLEIRWFGLEADFVRMLGMNNFRLRPNITNTPNVLEGTKSKVKTSTPSNEGSHQHLEYFNAFEERYRQTEEVLGMLIAQLSTALCSKKTLTVRKTALQKIKKLIHNPKNSKLTKPVFGKENSFFKAPLYILELRILSASPHYEHVEVASSRGSASLKALLQFSPQEVVFIRFTDVSSGIIMANVLLEDNYTVATLPEHGNHYLEFPW